jgi:hypothetical protein
MGKLEFCGGVAYLLHLVSICASPLDAFSYAEIIKREFNSTADYRRWE